ncbi:MAG: glycosyltransferase [Chitinophagaceae bacterium]
MKVSIITATFNSASTIADTLESVRIQTYPTIEHIIVDGLSTDEYINYCKQCTTH